MATIFIRGRTDPIIVSNERARIVKKNWCGDDPVGKDVILDLGEWAGEYGQIKSVELEKEVKYKPPEEEPSSQERMEGLKKMKEIGKELKLKNII